jgi:hypothetical protein
MVVYSLAFPKHKHFNFLADNVDIIRQKNSLPQKRAVFSSSNFSKITVGYL